MTARDDGGPAFPRPKVINPINGMVEHPGEPGLTMRDYFAAQALKNISLVGETPARVADWAYSLADAMLTERNKKDPT